MREKLHPPYLLPAEEWIEATDWKISWRGDSLDLMPVIEDWGGEDLRLTRAVAIDAAAIRQDCGLPEDAPLELVVTSFSNTTKMRRRVFRRRVEGRHNDIEAVLRGSEIGGTVTVFTRLVLGVDLPDGPPGTPRLCGSILAADSTRILVEGDGSMFPMAVIDFATRPYDARASWHVETSTDLDADFSAMFQVLINEQDTELVAAIESDKPNQRQQALLDELSSGVMQTVLEVAYAMKSEGTLDGGFPDGTVGDVLARLVDQTGDVDLGDLSEIAESSRRRTVFQAMARKMSAGRMF